MARIARRIDLFKEDRPLTLAAIEQRVLRITLQRNAGDKRKTAMQLGVSLKTIYNKLRVDVISVGDVNLGRRRDG